MIKSRSRWKIFDFNLNIVIIILNIFFFQFFIGCFYSTFYIDKKSALWPGAKWSRNWGWLHSYTWCWHPALCHWEYLTGEIFVWIFFKLNFFKMEIEKFKLTITALKRYSIFVTKSCTIFHFRYRNTLKCIMTSVFNVKKSKNLI